IRQNTPATIHGTSISPPFVRWWEIGICSRNIKYRKQPRSVSEQDFLTRNCPPSEQLFTSERVASLSPSFPPVSGGNTRAVHRRRWGKREWPSWKVPLLLGFPGAAGQD